jgi:hypothetical protein
LDADPAERILLTPGEIFVELENNACISAKFTAATRPSVGGTVLEAVCFFVEASTNN